MSDEKNRNIPKPEDVAAPQKTQVVMYQYKWPEGTRETPYPHPCMVVGIDKKTNPKKPQVYLAPISTTPPRNTTTSREIPEKDAKRLGLTATKSWVRTDEINIEENWPNNVRTIKKGPQAGQTLYGYAREGFFNTIQKDIQRNSGRERMKVVRRIEDQSTEDERRQQRTRRTRPPKGRGGR